MQRFDCQNRRGLQERAMFKTLITCALLPMLAIGCATTPRSAPTNPQDRFWAALLTHCGKAYAGRMVSDDPADADMRGAAMVMHVRECGDAKIAVPFHVQQPGGNWDRSRTWVLTRTGTGLRLKHDHRHEDGSADMLTLYGGDTASPGSAAAQNFPVDQESIALFQREGRKASITNVWRVEVTPARVSNPQFAYQLRRSIATGAPADRTFRVEFDLGKPVTPPPAPWGF